MQVGILRGVAGSIALSLVLGSSAGAQTAPAARAMPMAPVAHLKALVNVDHRGVGLGGYDPVAFFTDSAAMMGDSTYRASFGGATYFFMNEAHRALFQATPEKYVPRFGGFCAFGVSKGHAVPIQIETWQLINGRLTLNYNKSVEATFNQDVAGNLERANANWPGIVEKEGH